MAGSSFKRVFGWSQLGLEKGCGNFSNAVGLWSLAAWFDGGQFGGGWMPGEGRCSLSRLGLMEFLGGVRILCGGGKEMEDHIVICSHEGWFSIFIG